MLVVINICLVDLLLYNKATTSKVEAIASQTHPALDAAAAEDIRAADGDASEASAGGDDGDEPSAHAADDDGSPNARLEAAAADIAELRRKLEAAEHGCAPKSPFEASEQRNLLYPHNSSFHESTGPLERGTKKPGRCAEQGPTRDGERGADDPQGGQRFDAPARVGLEHRRGAVWITTSAAPGVAEF